MEQYTERKDELWYGINGAEVAVAAFNHCVQTREREREAHDSGVTQTGCGNNVRHHCYTIAGLSLPLTA